VLAAASRGAVAVAGAATTIVLARLLGPEGWGRFFVAQSLIAILLSATTLGVEHGIAYFVGAGRWPGRAALRTSATVAASVGSAGAAAAVVLRLLVPSAFAGLPVWLTAVVAAGLPFALAWLYASYIALATDRYEASMLMPAAQAVLVLALGVPGAVAFGTEGAVVGMTLASVLVGVGALVWGARRLPRQGDGAPGQLRAAVSFGVKGYAANALQLLNYRLDLFVLSAVASSAAVGRYSLAVSITSLLWLLPRALSDVLFPRVARLSGDGDEAAREMVETKSVRHASIVVGAGCVAILVGLELLVVPVFGSEYAAATNLGLILLPGAAVIGIGSVLAATIVGRGKPIYSLYTVLVSTPVTIALYAALIPTLHATGAALASTLSYVLSFALGAWFYRRLTGRHVLPLLLPTRSELDDLLSVGRRLVHRASGAAG
jgi:O-antigen/teichoic acid export membrane protein